MGEDSEEGGDERAGGGHSGLHKRKKSGKGEELEALRAREPGKRGFFKGGRK
jgi:hypothetical protein